MRRKLTFAVLLSLSAASPQTLALGIGEVDVRSSLNAPLRAVIPLTDTAGLDPELLQVSVAGPREFESAGLSRTPLAASVRTGVEVRQGQWLVTLASERAVREPWMDLMLRFDWPSGRQLREVTLLLDPPGYDSMPVLVSGGNSRSAPAIRPADPDREVAAAASRAVAAPVGSQAEAGGSHWVGNGDTLWSVAGRLRPGDEVSMDQMMVALVEANPEVFPSGNINSMRAGHRLSVPSRDAIMARSAEEASRVVQAMNQAWASRGTDGPARVPLGPAAPAGDIVEVAAADAAQAVAEPSATSAMPESVDRAEAAAAVPAAESTPRLTLLSDEELAAETQAQETAITEAKSDASLDAGVLAALGAGELAPGQAAPRLALLEERWQESRAALEDVQAERDALQQELGGLRDEVEAMREQLSRLLAGGAGVRGADQEAGASGAVTQSDTEEQAIAPWWGAMYPATYDRNLILGGAGLAALLGLWLWVRRRQRREAAAAMGSAAMPSMVHGMPPSPVAMPPSAPSATMPPMVAGMTVGDTGSQQEEAPRAAMPQAEAISEADIYMAYGRYDQARELLETGLSRDPARHDLRLKLLNVHVEQGSWPAAEEQMQTLAETGDSALLAEAARLMARRTGAPGDVADEVSGAKSPEERASSEGGDTAETDEATAAILPVEPRRGAGTDSPDAEEAHDEDAPADGGETLPDSALVYASFPRHEWADERHAAPAGDTQGEPEAVRAAPPAEETLSESSSRSEQDDHGIEWDVIDYQPPPLDPKPAPRRETPMQPSVDFPQVDELDVEHSASEEAEWEVEEVAFPPLEPDNVSAPGEGARRDDLAEARRLLEQGEVEGARPLLKRLLDGAEEPGLRDEVQALIQHYRL